MTKNVKENRKRYANNFSRIVSNKDTLFRIYLYWAILSVVFLGIFGIYPTAKSILNDLSIISEMKSVNLGLERRLSDLFTLKMQLDKVKNEIPLLDYYLPETFEIQNYMVDFVVASQEAGFNVQSFVPVQEESSSVYVNVGLLGEGDVVELIKNIEELNRITEVESVLLSRQAPYDILTLVVKNFIMERQ